MENMFEMHIDTISAIALQNGPASDAGGWSQGALLPYGLGRVAVFGEAAMFTAQLAGPAREPAGFNAPGAEANARLALRVLRWVARVR